MMTWTIKLGEHDIVYKSRIVVKQQVLADFISEFCHDSGSTYDHGTKNAS